MNPETIQPRRSRWQTSKSLARSAWRVLKLDHALSAIPVLSAFTTIALFVVAGLTIWLTSTVSETTGELSITGPLLDISLLSVLFYLSLYLLFTFIATYFSGALIAGLLQRFRGETPSVSSAFATARAHIGSLFTFSVLTGTIGYILQVIEEYSPLAGKVATWVLGAAWSIASMFALPVIVSAKKDIGPFAATRESLAIIKKTWGETAILNVGIGLVALLSFITFIAMMTGIGALTTYLVGMLQVGGIAMGISFGAVGLMSVVGLIGLGLVFTMLSAIVKAAIYHYATTGEAPAGFEQEIIRASFTPKKARGVFGS